MAPGEGLMLRNQLYDAYNRKHPHKTLLLNSVEESKLEDFRKNKIVTQMLSCKQVYEDWSITNGILSHPRVQELEAAQAKLKELEEVKDESQ